MKIPSLLLLTALLLANCQAQEKQEYPYTNALANESSPYLLQHAHNPVNWRPWGEEALEKARQEDKMLLISIGYAACHWCHVMEEESFEDTTVARIMNEHFIPIKVDREERPDVDDVYMTACQMASERGCGWPLNAFALPNGQPVWAGTYFPKKQWLDILQYFIKLYDEDREKLEGYASRLTEGIQGLRPAPVEEEAAFSKESLAATADNFLENIDFQGGGRKGAPKFPVPNSFEFLLHYHQLTGNERALKALNVTLSHIARGGIYDHLGGGFARYSTDAQWKVPHFEKMLYDNAQLVSLYSKAFTVTGKSLYQKRVTETLEFIQREMTSPEGGFYSSLDADSEGEEGKFYTWQKAEIDSILNDERDSRIFNDYYQIKAGGNWEDRNILYQKENLEEVLNEYSITSNELNEILEQTRKKLFAARAQRIRPGLDDKQLCSWNALMIQGYLDAYRALGEKAYLKTAHRSLDFLLTNMLWEGGRLNRNYKDGKSTINGFLDDYAFTVQALISMYEVTFDTQYLEQAEKLLDYTFAHFQEEGSPLFYYTSDESPALIARRMELEDNVIPASNSALAHALHRLGTLLYDTTYLERARAMMQAMAPEITDTRQPNFYGNWCSLYASLSYPYYEIAIVGPDYATQRDALLRHYMPDGVLLGGPTEGELELLKGKLQEGETYIYVCRNNVCKLPVQKVDGALQQLGRSTVAPPGR